MSLSFPSKPVHIFDSPEVADVKAKFVYNFFTPDESIDESGFTQVDGSLPARFRNKTSPDFSNIRARIPRLVEISIKFADDKARMTDRDVARYSFTPPTMKELKYWLSKGMIITETNATSDVYSAFTIGNSLISEEVQNLMNMKLNRFVTDGDSPASALDKLNRTTNVDPDTLSLMLPPELNNSPDGKKQTNFAKQSGDINKVRSSMQINSTFAPMMFRRSVERGTSLLDSTVNSNFTLAASRLRDLDKPIGHIDPTEIDELQFDIPYISASRISNAPDFSSLSEAAVVGVLINKTRIFKGKRYPMPPVVVTGQRPKLAFDSKVAYGQTYEYSVRTLSMFLVPVITPDGETYRYQFLVASKPSQPVQIEATENEKPLPPSDVRYSYDYKDGSLNIFWAPPTNPQRDVKYYQIFRRKSTLEPFELIAHIDFDDSLIRAEPSEYVDPSLVLSYPDPTYFFVDHEFSKETKFIYAIASVDARQLSSGYSTQTRIAFNSSKNRIDRKLVCFSGAPKQYPNWTLQENFFIDAMKDSSHAKTSIYFDPEAYTLIGGNGESIPAFFTNSIDPLAKYVFQFINTDRLLEQRFEVKIDDGYWAQEKSFDKGDKSKPKRPDKKSKNAKKIAAMKSEAKRKAREKKNKKRRRARR